MVLLAAQRYAGDHDLLLGGLMALALLARRQRPATVMAVVMALALVQFLLYEPYVAGPPAHAPAAYDVAVLFAMMSVVHHSRIPWMRMPRAAWCCSRRGRTRPGRRCWAWSRSPTAGCCSSTGG
ncbi:hypothetical protein [Streptomyces sp. T12]|uniref:hypothetical protein n=1 Tax=Streptomyces sp. T12 TaxID=477697 RepID=UPI0021BDD5EF|nr:hypothetical protein [Streptomyces sp. T12]